MPKRVRSAKGEIVDFDYLKIKEQLASAPTPTEVKTRQNFIESRMKRRLKKKTPVVESASVDVEPTLPEPADEVETKEDVAVAEASVVEEKTAKKTTTKQRARKKTTTKTETETEDKE